MRTQKLKNTMINNGFTVLLSNGEPNGASTLFGCCNPKEFDHPPTVFQRRSNAVDQEEFLLCPEFFA